MQSSDVVAMAIFSSIFVLMLIALWPLIPGINFESMRRPKSDWLRATFRIIWSPMSIFAIALFIVSIVFLLLALFYPEKGGIYTNLGTEGLGIIVTIIAIGIVNSGKLLFLRLPNDYRTRQ